MAKVNPDLQAIYLPVPNLGQLIISLRGVQELALGIQDAGVTCLVLQLKLLVLQRIRLEDLSGSQIVRPKNAASLLSIAIQSCWCCHPLPCQAAAEGHSVKKVCDEA